MAVPRRSNSLGDGFDVSGRWLVFADRRRTWYTFCFKQPNIILFFHILCCFPIQHLPFFSHIMLLPNDAKSMFLLTGVAESMFSITYVCFSYVFADRRRIIYVFCFKYFNIILFFSHIMLLSNTRISILKFLIASNHHHIISSYHHIIISSSHHMIMSSYHPIIISSSHHIIMSS